MPTVITQGAASAKGYGFGARATAANYIEDVFSTYLYNGNSSTQTITNGIDLSTKGGLVWSKSRASSIDHALYDTARGNKFLSSNTTNAQSNPSISGMSFTTTGYNLLGADGNLNNTSFSPYVSWTFRKQAKFFDVVTWTGDGTNDRVISHNLGSVPGCIIQKPTSTTGAWYTYHRSLTPPSGGLCTVLLLNTTDNAQLASWLSSAPTSTSFTVMPSGGTIGNANGVTYVAYLFAHDAGGFGASGSDNVISCGSFTKSAGVEATITLGYEPQWLLFKRTDAAENWFMIDNMRGMPVGGTDAYLIPNLSSAENNLDFVTPTATGFIATNNFNTGTYIYIAIRRGPMKTPTSGTSVFSPITSSGATGTTLTTNFPVDMLITKYRAGVASNAVVDRLRRVSTNSTEQGNVIYTNSNAAEAGTVGESLNWNNTGFQVPSSWGGISNVFYSFRRAPGFFDEVCYTGTGAVNTLNHNLGVVPEIWIIKRRSGGTGDWFVGGGLIGSGTNAYLLLNSTAANVSGLTNLWLTPTSTTFGIGSYNPSDNGVNASGSTYVAYLFATVAGVSKVGSYTGTGTTQQIDCGFTAGARFVLIKRTDSTGGWYVWDSARGIVAGNDPYLLLNSTAAEVTNTDYIDTYSAGFEISSTAPAAINANGGSFIYLAIA